MLSENFKNLHLQLSQDDIRKIDEWKVQHGMKSRSEAIRSIIRIVTNNEEADSTKKSLYEKDTDFITPPSNQNNSRDDSLEEIIRRVVKEELLKETN